MADMGAFLTAMKKQAIKAMESTNPVQVLYGTVTSVSPLRIVTDQELPLEEADLILARNVTDYRVEATVEWESQSAAGGSGEAAFAGHTHKISGRKAILMHNGLSVGEKVFLVRQQEGQKYLVADRVVSV